MTFDDRTWLWIAAACYVAGLLLGTFFVLRGRQQTRAVMYAIIGLGFAVQTFGLYLRGLEVKGCPLGNTFELFQFTAWSATALYLVVGATFRLSLLGYFTSMMAAAMTLLSLAIPGWDATRRVGVFGNNAWIEFHAAIALFSYGVFALLALTSAMYLLRIYSLKHKHLSGFFAFLPSIRDLDVICARLLAVGVTLLAASLLVGAVYWLPNTETVNTAKLLSTLGVWAAFLAAWILRRTGKLYGKRLSWVCIALFAAALLSIAPVNSSRPSTHDAAPAPTVTAP